MDLTTPFDQRLAHVPYEWRGPIVDVVDTFETVQIGLKALGIRNPQVLLEAVKLVLDRHDRASVEPAEPCQGDLFAANFKKDIAQADDAQSPAAADTGVGDLPLSRQDFWLELLIRDYIPMKIKRGEYLFSSPSLMKWIDSSHQPELTEYDLREDSNTLAYKRMISDALASLKTQGVLSSRARGKIYFINKSVFTSMHGD